MIATRQEIPPGIRLTAMIEGRPWKATWPIESDRPQYAHGDLPAGAALKIRYKTGLILFARRLSTQLRHLGYVADVTSMSGRDISWPGSPPPN